MRLLFLSILFLSTQAVFSQDTIPYYIEDVKYTVYNGMDPEIKSEFLELIDAVELEVAPFTDVDYPIRVTREDGKQNLMLHGNVQFIHKKDLEEIAFFTRTSRMVGITFGKYKGQQKIIFQSDFTQKTNKDKDTWDEIIWRNKDWFEQEMKGVDIGEYYGDFPIPEFYVKNNGLWGVIGITGTNGIQIIVPTIYKNKQDITTEYWPRNYTPDFEKIRKKFKIDLIEPLQDLDDFYKVRSREEQKWGVVHAQDTYNLMLDVKYDSITGSDDHSIIFLWRNNYVGVSNDKGKIFYPTSYQSYEFVNLDYMYGIALKKDNRWSLYSLEEPKKLVEQSAETPEQLIEYWLNKN